MNEKHERTPLEQIIYARRLAEKHAEQDERIATLQAENERLWDRVVIKNLEISRLQSENERLHKQIAKRKKFTRYLLHIRASTWDCPNA